MLCVSITDLPPQWASPSGAFMSSEMHVRMGARQALCSPVPSLPLSFHLRGPMGEATVASHVFLLANDKVAATAPMNYAG